VTGLAVEAVGWGALSVESYINWWDASSASRRISALNTISRTFTTISCTINLSRSVVHIWTLRHTYRDWILNISIVVTSTNYAIATRITIITITRTLYTSIILLFVSKRTLHKTLISWSPTNRQKQIRTITYITSSRIWTSHAISETRLALTW